MEEKMTQMESDLNVLYSKIDDGEMLSDSDQMAMDIYNWIIHDSDKPEID